jgi:hypothetical protein
MSKLTSKQMKALPALAAAPNTARGCREAGISRNTANRWGKDPEYAEELQKHRETIMGKADESITAAVNEAASVLVGLLKSDNESLRLRAANLIMEHAEKFRVDGDYSRRLEAIERAQKEAAQHQ